MVQSTHIVTVQSSDCDGAEKAHLCDGIIQEGSIVEVEDGTIHCLKLAGWDQC